MELARFKLLIRERFRCVFFSEGGVNVSWNWVPCTFMFIWDLRFCFKRWYFIQVGWSALRTKTLSVFCSKCTFCSILEDICSFYVQVRCNNGKSDIFSYVSINYSGYAMALLLGHRKKIVPFLFPSILRWKNSNNLCPFKNWFRDSKMSTLIFLIRNFPKK